MASFASRLRRRRGEASDQPKYHVISGNHPIRQSDVGSAKHTEWRAFGLQKLPGQVTQRVGKSMMRDRLLRCQCGVGHCLDYFRMRLTKAANFGDVRTRRSLDFETLRIIWKLAWKRVT